MTSQQISCHPHRVKFTEFSALAGQVDVDKGIISGVSVITEGPAKGHGNLHIDKKTLDQVLAVALSHSGGIKVKLNHSKEARVENSCGVLKNFRLDGNKVRADLHLFKSDANFSKILELAQTISEDFGLSVVFAGVHEKNSSSLLARCTEIYSTDLVDRPAANPDGLFSADKNMKQELLEAFKDPEVVAALKTLATPEAPKAEELAKSLGIDKIAASITALQANADEAKKLSEKSERTALVAEASRDGKVIPLSNEAIEKTELSVLKEMISKLPKGAVSTNKSLNIPAKADEKATFLAQKHEDGARELGALIKRQVSLSN